MGSAANPARPEDPVRPEADLRRACRTVLVVALGLVAMLVAVSVLMVAQP